MTSGSKSHRPMLVIATAVAASLAMAAGAQAASPEAVAKITGYSGSDRQAFLEAGARKEGKLLIYTVGTQIRPVLKAFKNKYPFVEYQLFRAGSAKIARRVLEEYKAGFYKVDAFELNVGALAPIRDAGYLARLNTPQAANYGPNATEPKKHWLVARESYLALGYNTTKVSNADAPKTYKDLLDPKWKGKMAISGRASTLTNWIGAMVLSQGEAYVRKLGGQNIRVYKTSGRALANLIVSGEVALSPAVYNSHVFKSRSKGGKIAWRALGATSVTVTGVAVASRANNPHSAMLLVDFMLSKPAQKLYAKLGYSSAHKDMPDKSGPKNKVYLANRPTFARDFETWSKLGSEVFVKRKK